MARSATTPEKHKSGGAGLKRGGGGGGGRGGGGATSLKKVPAPKKPRISVAAKRALVKQNGHHFYDEGEEDIGQSQDILADLDNNCAQDEIEDDDDDDDDEESDFLIRSEKIGLLPHQTESYWKERSTPEEIVKKSSERRLIKNHRTASIKKPNESSLISNSDRGGGESSSSSQPLLLSPSLEEGGGGRGGEILPTSNSRDSCDIGVRKVSTATPPNEQSTTEQGTYKRVGEEQRSADVS